LLAWLLAKKGRRLFRHQCPGRAAGKDSEDAIAGASETAKNAEKRELMRKRGLAAPQPSVEM
jgi:hypothetical protein